jgi:RNA polymerase sigma-70 factor, ECF subfamily
VSGSGDSAQTGADPDMHDEQEVALMERMAAGELSALESIYDRYSAVAYALALRITADAGLAEDVVQDAMLGVWMNARRYDRARASLRTWLLSIVHHRAIDVVRRRRPSTSLETDIDEAAGREMVLGDVWPEVAGRLDGEAIRTALAGLSDVQREAVELAYFGGLTQQEIAQRTGAPLGTVKSRVRLGLLALHDALLEQVRATDEAGGAA